MGFFGFAYYSENSKKLKAVAIDNGKGAVGPSEKTVLDGTYQPLSRPIYIYVSKKSLDKAGSQGVRRILSQKRSASSSRKSNMSRSRIKSIRSGADRVKSGKVGTAFGGHADVGVTIDDLVKREPKL